MRLQRDSLAHRTRFSAPRMKPPKPCHSLPKIDAAKFQLMPYRSPISPQPSTPHPRPKNDGLPSALVLEIDFYAVIPSCPWSSIFPNSFDTRPRRLDASKINPNNVGCPTLGL